MAVTAFLALLLAAAPHATPSAASTPATPAAPGPTTKPTSAPASAPASAPTSASTTGTADFTSLRSGSYVKEVVAAHHGRPVLVNFWASYCLPCLEELPALLALQKEYKDRAAIVFVNFEESDDQSHIRKILQRRGIPSFPSFQAQDPEGFLEAVGNRWQGELPVTVFYGADGTLQRFLLGGQSPAFFKAALDEAIAAPQPPEVP